MMAINLPPEIECKLAAFAMQTGQSESVVVGQAIVDFIEEMEDVLAVQQRLAEGNERISLTQLREKLV